MARTFVTLAGRITLAGSIAISVGWSVCDRAHLAAPSGDGRESAHGDGKSGRCALEAGRRIIRRTIGGRSSTG